MQSVCAYQATTYSRGIRSPDHPRLASTRMNIQLQRKEQREIFFFFGRKVCAHNESGKRVNRKMTRGSEYFSNCTLYAALYYWQLCSGTSALPFCLELCHSRFQANNTASFSCFIRIYISSFFFSLPFSAFTLTRLNSFVVVLVYNVGKYQDAQTDVFQLLTFYKIIPGFNNLEEEAI